MFLKILKTFIYVKVLIFTFANSQEFLQFFIIPSGYLKYNKKMFNVEVMYFFKLWKMNSSRLNEFKRYDQWCQIQEEKRKIKNCR